MLSCRIISILCCHAQPHIGLEEIINRKDLNQLILLNISAEFNHGSVCWGSPWSQYAILSLFMDVIESERVTDEQSLGHLPTCSSTEETQADSKEFTKIIEENEEPTIEQVMEVASSSVYDAIKLSSNLAKNFTQISDMLEVQLNDVDKKPFKIDETDATKEFKDEKPSELIEDNEEEDDEEAETLTNVSNNKFAKLDFASIKNLNLLEALTHLKNTGINVSLLAMISAAVSNQDMFPQQKFSAKYEFELAEKYYRNFLSKHPQYIDCFLRLGSMFCNRGHIHEASEWFKEAVCINKSHPNVWTQWKSAAGQGAVQSRTEAV